MINKLNILYVEDDFRFFENFKSALSETANFRHARDNSEAESWLNKEFYDAVLVDLNISSFNDGASFAEKLISHYNLPVVFLTSDNSAQSKIECLKIGVSDYLWKTMNIEEIKVRITNSVRNYKRIDSGFQYQIGNLKLVLSDSLVIIDEIPTNISALELRLLSHLLKVYPRGVERSEITKKIWFVENVSSGAISTAIYQLNKKLTFWNYKVVSSKGLQIILAKKLNTNKV